MFNVILPFLVFAVWIIATYLIILFGFKLFKIDTVPPSKIIIFIVVLFVVGSFLNNIIGGVLELPDNRLLHFLRSSIISLALVYILLRYYFLLLGKKLWQFLVYLVVVNVILSTVSTLILSI